MASNFDIVPTRLAVKAMRDNGYKNTAYAIAELIDNSVQAQAKIAELICVEKVEQVVQRSRRRVMQIAVVDNGKGMDKDTLRQALQFGNGMYLDDRSGIGRFGMGLPSSSISQCRRVDVWSWQVGPDNALHTHLDLDKIETGLMLEVPEPEPSSVPATWRKLSKGIGTTGTLVVWSNLDRLMWRGAKATLSNAEYLIGRMYRRFIHEGQVVIRLAAVDEGGAYSLDTNARVNDPMYLMVPSSTPEPFHNKAMFRRYGETGETVFKVEFNGADHEVKIRMSWASDEARLLPDGSDAGRRLWGKHAADNLGVSLMRAGRELDLDTGWASTYDPVDRWWGIEVEFPPSLDEIFGVTNNKQAARHFSELANLDEASLRLDGETDVEMYERLKQERDPRAPLLEIVRFIRANIIEMKKLLKQQTAGRRSVGKKRHEEPSAEDKATNTVNQRKEEGHTGESDAGPTVPPPQREEQLATDLQKKGYPEQTAKELAAATVYRDRKFLFAEAPLDNQAFFSVEIRAQTIEITLNQSHPAYEHLVEILISEHQPLTAEELKARLERAGEGLKLLLCAWARYEDETPAVARERLKKARSDWGIMARDFLRDGEG